jgi:hypothetical protein
MDDLLRDAEVRRGGGEVDGEVVDDHSRGGPGLDGGSARLLGHTVEQPRLDGRGVERLAVVEPHPSAQEEPPGVGRSELPAFGQ